MIEQYIMSVFIYVCIYIILTLSLNISLGYTGLINLGHIALFGIGAYSSTLLMMNLDLPFIISFLSAGIITSLFGLLLVFATKKLKGDYFALATLGFSFVIYSLLLNLVGLTRGPLGIPGIPKPSFFGITLTTTFSYLLFAIFITALCVFIIYKIVHSPFGRLLQATRDDEIGLRVLGKNTNLLKYKSMMISAFFAAIAGSLFAHYITFIDPTSFVLHEVILLLTMVIVGGIASFKGSIIAPFIIILIPELLRFLSIPSAILGPMRQIIYAFILLLILYYKPRGLFGRVDLA
ncbi:branched-chain amino acid ABC transporter permease [Candidatus Woesearchaeota archaeon]|nr:branched-chain amino acid ABC transporter permease [Candidatus Woesearchaeota archaeon]